MKYGYVRDSLNSSWAIELQKKILKERGVDTIIVENVPKNVGLIRFLRKFAWSREIIENRFGHCELKHLLEIVGAGDSVHVVSFDRLTRNKKTFNKIKKALENKSVDLIQEEYRKGHNY